MKTYMRAMAAGLCVLMGTAGAANADFNFYRTARGQDRAYRVQGRATKRGAACASATRGDIAGAAIASSARPRYCDPYYEYCGPRRVYRDEYGRSYYAPPRRRPARPDHYPVDLY